jgi:hypothetical protein
LVHERAKLFFKKYFLFFKDLNKGHALDIAYGATELYDTDVGLASLVLRVCLLAVVRALLTHVLLRALLTHVLVR